MSNYTIITVRLFSLFYMQHAKRQCYYYKKEFVKFACQKILYNLVSHSNLLNSNNVYKNRIFGVMPDIFARKRIFYLTLNRLAGQHRAAYLMEIYAKAPPPLSRRGRENSVDGYERQLRRPYLGPL